MAFDESGTKVADKTYPNTGAYEARYYPIEDLYPAVNSTDLTLQVSVVGGTGKVIAVGSGTANTSNDSTTFEMQFADSLLGGADGLTVVSHDGTLTGDGTAATPLGIANGGVGKAKLAASGGTSGQVLGTDGTSLQWQAAGGAGLPTGTAGQTLRSNGSTWLANSVLNNDGTNVGITGNLNLPNTTATTGQINFGGSPFLHNYGPAGAGNTFVGQSVGNFTISGGSNTAIGAGSLQHNTTGHGNTASGVAALSSNTTGVWNTASGALALQANTAGSDNTATGWQSLNSNTTVSDNTAVGFQSLVANTAGSDNTATGFQSLSSNTTASKNTAMGSGALFTQSFSNSNTPWDSWNTAVGYQALHANQPDATNDGFLNTAVGAEALASNATGSYNTAIGTASLQSNTTASKNTAVGSGALYTQSYSNNSTAYDTYNTAVGYQALYANQPDLSYSGGANTAVGARALMSTTVGQDNTASGSYALYGNTTGSSNIGIGYYAGINLTTGSHNIDIGNQGVAGDSNTIRIGDMQGRAFIAGISGVAISGGITVLIDSAGQLGTPNSSLRFKQDVADMGDVSSRLMELRPVTFHYKTQPDGPLQYGLIPEEVDEVMPELVVHDATGQVESVAYHEMPAMLLNELQKQQAQISDQAKTIQSQQTEIEALMARLAAIEARVAGK